MFLAFVDLNSIDTSKGISNSLLNSVKLLWRQESTIVQIYKFQSNKKDEKKERKSAFAIF